MKIFGILLSFCLFTLFGHADTDFEREMGKETSQWEFLETKEDLERLAFFKSIFDKRESAPPKQGVPEILHFVWLGPDALPQEFVKRMTQWIDLHPGWKVKLWMDVPIPSPLPSVQVSSVSLLPFTFLQKPYELCDQILEKEKVLIYEILLHEGGVVIDHRLAPLKSLKPLNEKHDFFCGLEELGPTVLSTSVVAGHQLIGASANHPIIEEAAKWLGENWENLERSFPVTSALTSINRLKHRTLWALSVGIERAAHEKGHHNLVLPASFFSSTKRSENGYAIYQPDPRLTFPKTSSEKVLQKQIKQLVKTDNQALQLTLALAIMSFVACIAMLRYARQIHEDH